MPTTYSNSLRLSLIGNGEQAGTWGTTTNTNLGTLLDTAVAGNVTVPITSATQALTAENGVSDQARQAIITLTISGSWGTPGDFSIYAPNKPKQYIVFNNTAYNASLRVGNGVNSTTAVAGNVPLVIAAGRKLVVFCDSTSFFTIDSSGITGILAVANGGTGVAYSTGSSAYTGTGVVLSTTPTLTNPTLVTQTVAGNSVVTGAFAPTGSTYLNGIATGVNYAQTIAQGVGTINTSTNEITLPSALYSNDMAVLLSSSVTMPTGLSTNTPYYVINTNRTAFFSGVGSISGTTLTINSVYTGSIGVDTLISGTGVTSVLVTGLGTGTGGAGTYSIAGASQTVDTRIINGTYSGPQSFKLSTSLSGGSAVAITNVGSGNLTLTPISLGITAPVGTTTNASGFSPLATCAFVSASNPFSSTNWTATETVATQSASFTSASPTVVTVTAAPATGTAVSYSTTGTLPSSITANAAYYAYNLSSTTYNLSTTAGTSQTATITAGASFTATINNGTVGVAGTIMTVTAVSAGPIVAGQTISGAGITGTPTISAFGTSGTTGVGGTGTYIVSTSQNIGSTSITASSIPGVITVAAAPANGDIVSFATTGALPTGLTAGPPTFYYVVNRTSTTFQVSATSGGSAITTSGTQSGTHTATWRTLVNTTATGSGITETTSKLVFRYKNLSKFSIDLGGNLVAAGNITAFGSP
jgi:hypothetical protein